MIKNDAIIPKMSEMILLSGNEAIARGAIQAGCRAFFGYPITPQSEIPEFMAREMPRLGGTFLQAECETAAAGMVFGASMAGVRAMTSTSGPGFSLMQEFISCMSAQLCPAVIVDVVRGGPGTGHLSPGQTDYRQVTKGGGHGGYRCIVLAPFSSQECFDLIQLAFDLAEKYRIVVIMLSDAFVGLGQEYVEIRQMDLSALPPKSWTVRGRDYGPAGKEQFLLAHRMLSDYRGYHLDQKSKYEEISRKEARYEKYRLEDASVAILAYGYTSRMALGAVNLLRKRGIKAGLFRPVTLWPLPEKELKEAALQAVKVLVVEDSPDLFREDVERIIQGQAPVHSLGIEGRDSPGPAGLIFPERIAEEVEKIL